MFLDAAVFHVGGDGGTFIYHAYAYIQGTGPFGGNGQPCVHIQVIDGIFVAGFHHRVFCVIHRRIGHCGNGGALQFIRVHVIAGLESSHTAARYRAGHVKGGHSLLRIRCYGEVIGIDGILCFTGITGFVTFLRSVPGSGRRGNPRRRHPVDLVGSTGKAGRNACF